MRTLIRMARSRDEFMGGVSTLVAGTMGGQLVVLGLSPILTRLYRPEDFGILGVFASALALLTVIATLRYELALPVADDVEVGSLLALVLFVLAVSAIGTALLASTAGAELVGMLNAAVLRPYLWLLAIGVGFAGLLQMLTYLRIRDRAYGQLARSRLIQAAATTLSQIGLAGVGPLGLLVGYVGGRLAGLVLLVRVPSNPAPVSVTSIAQSAARYRRFPLVTMWASLINALGLQFPNLILAAAFGPSVVGLFSLTIRVIQAPMAMLGQAVSQVFLGGLAAAVRSHEVAGYARSTFSILSLVALAPAGLAMLWAPDVFSVVFGPEWRGAGDMARFLIPWIALAFVGQPLTSLAFAMGGQRMDLGFQVALAMGRLGALALGVASEDHLFAIQAFAAVSAAVWLVYIIWLLGLSGTSVWYGLWQLARCVGAGTLVAIPVGLARLTGAEAIGTITASIASIVILAVVLRAGMGAERCLTSHQRRKT
jgi:O-antigen/teichoic acid export membrane protein